MGPLEATAASGMVSSATLAARSVIEEQLAR